MKNIVSMTLAATLLVTLSPLAWAYQSAEESYLNYNNPTTSVAESQAKTKATPKPKAKKETLI